MNLSLRPSRLWNCPALAIIGGASLQAVMLSEMTGEGTSLWFRLLFGAWLLAPYLLLSVFANWKVTAIRPAMVCGAGTVVMAADAYNYWSVFVVPSSSTASLVLLAAPFYNVVIWIPWGMCCGYAIDRWMPQLLRNGTGAE